MSPCPDPRPSGFDSTFWDLITPSHLDLSPKSTSNLDFTSTSTLTLDTFCNLDERNSNKVLEVVQTVVTGKSSVSSVLSSEMAAERVEDVQQANAEVQATKD
jgi:hypothetical protein